MAKHSKRFKYYQPNKKDIKDKVGDCQIRALSKALNKTWLEVFDIITPICREQQVMDIFSCDLAKTKEAMKQLGFEYTGVSNKRGTKRRIKLENSPPVRGVFCAFWDVFLIWEVCRSRQK